MHFGLVHKVETSAGVVNFLVFPDRESGIRKTGARNQDPDVAVFKGLAKSSLETGQSVKLARVINHAISIGMHVAQEVHQ